MGNGMELATHLKERKVDPTVAGILLLFARESAKVRAAFHEAGGKAGTQNMYGEQQMELDKFADRHFIDALKASGLVQEIASEEQDEIVKVPSGKPFAVCMDPLDGSSCIETNLTVGTIIGIHHGSALKLGKDLAAAAYLLYGPLTTLVYSDGRGVHEFVQSMDGKFRLRAENLRLGTKKIFGPGGAKSDCLRPGHAKFIAALEEQGYKIRFSGSFVADFNQILHYGGLFTYPSTKEAPEGKLRLLFECQPIAFICRAAGGDASTGLQKVLEVMPAQLSQRTPLYVGGKKEIALVERFLGK